MSKRAVKSEHPVLRPFDNTKRKTAILFGHVMPLCHLADMTNRSQDELFEVINVYNLPIAPNPPGRTFRGLLDVDNFYELLIGVGWSHEDAEAGADYWQRSVRYVITKGASGRKRAAKRQAEVEQELESYALPPPEPEDGPDSVFAPPAASSEAPKKRFSPPRSNLSDFDVAYAFCEIQTETCVITRAFYDLEWETREITRDGALLRANTYFHDFLDSTARHAHLQAIRQYMATEAFLKDSNMFFERELEQLKDHLDPHLLNALRNAYKPAGLFIFSNQGAE